jgi:amino acid transporter
MKPDDPADNGAEVLTDDIRTLHRMGYAQELARSMSGFSNLALSMSIICILAGGLTSFHLGYCSVGGASIGIGWPLACLFSLVVAATMAQLASAFPTAGGLYHWSAILGGRGWGWTTGWFNLAGLVTVLAAINVGTFEFFVQSFFPGTTPGVLVKILAVAGITASHALLNHLGIRVTTRLTDFSGYWILAIAALLTASLLWATPQFDWSRLVTFDNFSGLPTSEPVWPQTSSLVWLFALGLLLPAYTITGFDASAHASEETIGAAMMVPRGIIRSVLVSGIAGWLMLVAIVLAIPDPRLAASQGTAVFHWTAREVLPATLAQLLFGGIVIAQYLCGLATVTSASRMTFAFARDGGLPFSRVLRHVDAHYRTPVAAIWTVALLSILFTVYTPVYSTITVVCAIFIYLSYVLPSAIGMFTYGRSWTQMGPWQLGRWFRPFAVLAVIGCAALIVIGMQPPNEKAVYAVGGMTLLLAMGWLAVARRNFVGPPDAVTAMRRRPEIAAAEAAVHETATESSASSVGSLENTP